MRSDVSTALLSVMGPHAGEDAEHIFARKIDDIGRIGKTYWVVGSPFSRPELTREVCMHSKESSLKTACLFISPSTIGGAKQTKSDNAAKEWSIDKINWYPLPDSLSPVTGRMTKGAYALVFDELVLQDEAFVDLWDYADYFNPERPIRFRMGASTVCALKKNMHDHPEKIKSNKRKLIAVGSLADPYAVWLRS